MARERHYEAQGPFAFTADGGADGKITLESVGLLKVKQTIKLSAIGQSDLQLEIKRVLSPTQIIVGPKDSNLNSKADVSSYTVADNATVFFNGDSKSKLKVDDIWQAVYEQEPTVALRMFSVDQYGSPWNVQNPFPVRLSDGSVNIGTVNAEMEVQLSHRNNYPDNGDVADSVQIGDGEDIAQINPDGSFNVSTSEGVPSLDTLVDIVNNITYKGIAKPNSDTSDPVWKISRTVKTFNNKTNQIDEVTLVAGTGIFDQVWDDRASLFPAVVETQFFDRNFEKLLPLLSNANWMKLGNFDRITPSFTNEVATLNYYESGANIGRADIKYNNELDWEINLNRFINDANGDILLDDDGTELNLD